MSACIASVAVFCGSRFGNLPAYREAAVAMGCGLARAGIHLIYGGGYVGLMGAVADAAIEAGGTVTGIIPEFLEAREVMHRGITELIVTCSMHTRKQQMFADADAFAILPGGFGTFDEMMEIITWKQLQLHAKPILIVNVANWAAPALAMLDAAVAQGFASPEARALVQVVPDVSCALTTIGATARSTAEKAESVARL
ncbi:LOG family protein [Acetobacter fallax]|uniref:Cytokinin riboside 5'-monophosphate phosphoribohydrolase n=1 Tax=Acetobacter fallax TaxID=1737473 RepID=A0ABX0KE68_9PROT|nr:TIGR00730 family Rossman fold protein [Acetobacter fallax]NHO33441.1 TIGR00730 family Rossman fold protein [Acetobacter fallax]NHO37080.1 TIGR00730 family Rossman fold protein [Acetobacter fallax]